MEKYTITLGEIIENNVDIFDFDYPIFNESYRPTFQEHFIKHFYYDEIGQETVARFKDRLNIKLNLIMPYWNKVFLADNLEQRILDNYDVTETYTRTTENNINSNGNQIEKNLFSENPVERIDFEQVDYFSNITKNIGENTNNTSGESKEQWTRKMTGNIGIQTDSDAINKYYSSLRKIEIEIFTECEDLFMGVY